MEREELLGLVNAELGDNRLTLSERTINEELDDVLGDFGDDQEANTAMVARVANRLRRMDGNQGESRAGYAPGQWQCRTEGARNFG